MMSLYVHTYSAARVYTCIHIGVKHLGRIVVKRENIFETCIKMSLHTCLCKLKVSMHAFMCVNITVNICVNICKNVC